MSAYRKVVVGTDGSESSMRAVDRAGQLASGEQATLIIACAYVPADSRSVSHAADQLGDDAYQILGDNPAEDIVRTARDRAVAAGATSIQMRTVKGAPVDSLVKLADEEQADLLVVGNKGMASLTGRLLGSVPSDAARRARCDVLIVHTV